LSPPIEQGVRFSALLAKAVFTSLIGGAVLLATVSVNGLTKLIPGFGTTAETLRMVTVGGASTDALGRVLTRLAPSRVLR